MWHPRETAGRQAGPMAASIEASAARVLRLADLHEMFPPGTAVYLADLGGGPANLTAEASGRLIACGYRPVPHIAARRLDSHGDLERRLVGYREAGVEDLLVIAGGLPRAAGPFADSLAILKSGLIERLGFRRIAVAGHPEGSADISAPALAAALREKNAIAADSDAAFRIVSQFGFDAAAIIDWAWRIGDHNRLPIHVGIAGPAKLATLARYAAICGIGASLRLLAKRAGTLRLLSTDYSPDALVEPIEADLASNPGGPIQQLHVYPFGGLAEAAAWLYGRGSWRHDAAVDCAASGSPVGMEGLPS